MARLYENNEAQYTGRERAMIDKERVKIKARDIRDKFGLRFNDGKLLIFFRSEEEMKRKRNRLVKIHGECEVILPKIKKDEAISLYRRKTERKRI